MQFEEVLFGRRSVRDYHPDQVSREDVDYVINAAIHAPTPLNQQPYAFTIVRDQALLDRVSHQAKSHLLNNSAFGVRPSPFRNQVAQPDFQIFYHAPMLIVISDIEETTWSVEACTLAAGNLMLAAHARGLGSCWIGLAQPWLRADDGKTALRLPRHYRPVAPIVVGHPRTAPTPVNRHAPTVTWND